MKKQLVFASACLLALCLGLAACGSGSSNAASSASNAGNVASSSSATSSTASSAASTGSGAAASNSSAKSEKQQDADAFTGTWELVESTNTTESDANTLRQLGYGPTAKFNADGTCTITMPRSTNGEVAMIDYSFTWKAESATSAHLFEESAYVLDAVISNGKLTISNNEMALIFRKANGIAQQSTANSTSGSSTSASAASASTTADGISYKVTDRFFRETYEEDGKALFDTVLEVANTGNKTIVFDSVNLAVTNGAGLTLATPSNVYLSPNYILPGKSAFVYPASPIKLPDVMSANYEYKTGFSVSFKTTDKTVTEYPTAVDTYYDDGGHPAIGGTVTNNTNAASGDITVVVSYFDKDGGLLGVAESTVSSLKPGQSSRFRMLGDDVQHHCSWDLVASYELHATSLN